MRVSKDFPPCQLTSIALYKACLIVKLDEIFETHLTAKNGFFKLWINVNNKFHMPYNVLVMLCVVGNGVDRMSPLRRAFSEVFLPHCNLKGKSTFHATSFKYSEMTGD